MRPRNAIIVMTACIVAGAGSGALASQLSPALVPTSQVSTPPTAPPAQPADPSSYGTPSMFQPEDLFILGWAPRETQQTVFEDDGPNQISPCQPGGTGLIDLSEHADVRRVDYLHNGMYLGELAAQSPTEADARGLASQLRAWHRDCAVGSTGKYSVSEAHPVEVPNGEAHWYQFIPDSPGSPPGFGGVVRVGARSAMFAVNRETLTEAQLASITQQIAKRLS